MVKVNAMKIVYCVPCGYKPHADALKEELERAGYRVSLEGGHNGVFDVFMDDKMVFSRWEQKRFPHPGEIKEMLK